MLDLYEPDSVLNLSRVELSTLSIALVNLPDDKETMRELLEKQHNKKVSDRMVEDTLTFARTLKHRLMHRLVESSAELIKSLPLELKNEHEEYEEI